jgi:hypothetical protein
LISADHLRKFGFHVFAGLMQGRGHLGVILFGERQRYVGGRGDQALDQPLGAGRVAGTGFARVFGLTKF